MADLDRLWLENPAEILISEEELDRREREMAEVLVDTCKDMGSIILITVLDGARPFADNLVRHARELPDCPDIDREFVRTKTYVGMAAKRPPTVEPITPDGYNPPRERTLRHVVVVDDILDKGKTMIEVCERVTRRSPASLSVFVMLDKQGVRLPDFSLGVDNYHAGFKIADRFVVGHGLDYDELYRDLPFITVCHTEPPLRGQPMILPENYATSGAGSSVVAF